MTKKKQILNYKFQQYVFRKRAPYTYVKPFITYYQKRDVITLS